VNEEALAHWGGGGCRAKNEQKLVHMKMVVFLALIYVTLSSLNEPSQSIGIKYHTKILHVNTVCHSAFFKMSPISYS